MKQKYYYLPRRFKKEEIIQAPMSWTNLLSNYSYFRKEALKETKPGCYSLIAIVLTGIVKQDKHLIDIAVELTKETVPKHVYLSVIGPALCTLGLVDEGIVMLQEAVKLEPAHSTLLLLAAEVKDLEQQEELCRRVLSENPQDIDAMRHLAYAKYFKGETEEAERLIDKILKADPDNIFALEYRGNISFDKKDYKDALKQYQRIKLKPMPISLQLRICYCFHFLGLNSKAKKIAKKLKSTVASLDDSREETKLANEYLPMILNA